MSQQLTFGVAGEDEDDLSESEEIAAVSVKRRPRCALTMAVDSRVLKSSLRRGRRRARTALAPGYSELTAKM